MSRTKSSTLAHAQSLVEGLIGDIIELKKEFDILTVTSERLKEIEPALHKLQAALNPAPVAPFNPEVSNTPPSQDELVRIAEYNVPKPPVRERHPRKKKEAAAELTEKPTKE
jgi:hypothetical protein